MIAGIFIKHKGHPFQDGLCVWGFANLELNVLCVATPRDMMRKTRSHDSNNPSYSQSTINTSCGNWKTGIMPPSLPCPPIPLAS